MKSSTILAVMENYMKQNYLNGRQFAELIGVNPGTLTYFLNGQRIITVCNLDKLTEVMGYPEGYFYEQYIEDYLRDRTPNWRRIGPYLNRCVEIGKIDCFNTVVNILMEHSIYCNLLFEMAEKLFKQGNYTLAETLYENIALSEEKQYSERLAVCQYRLFKIKLGKNQVDNYKVASQFEPFVDRLDEWEQLDALKDLANVYRSLRNWDQLELFAKEMEYKANLHYFSKKRESRNPTQLSRPLFVYITYSKLLLAEVCEGRKDFEGALRYTYEYADLSWVQEQDEDTLYWKESFEKWAKVNTFANNLLNGDISVLDDYVKYLRQNRNELLLGIFNIVYAANRYNFNIDPILLEFQEPIQNYSIQAPKDVYATQVLSDHYNTLLYELTCYYLNKRDYINGINTLSKGLENAVALHKEKNIIKFSFVFEMYFSRFKIEQS
ncbi:helix-turn-helix transcriptional regulator [Paenibacillus turicensis]|uniref:helix-turn-helix domain-containing protein n=1 Tax=Paenibacillus turicensis TaxID=160487 RepID=UPI003D28C683